MNAESGLAIFFIGDSDVDEAEQFRHNVLGGLAVFPEILTEVQIAGDGQPGLSSRAHTLEREGGGGLAQSRCDPGDMEPDSAREGRLPVDIAGLRQGDGTVIAIVNYFGRPLICPWFDEVDAQPSRGADH